ncbi:excisionase family DNA binding protein [Microbacterium sp. BE35]|uniref:helix-turn-helix domain-containing protein n=1 Tax=Microbacterium sp. BE35 TaxID=2817773 RepID=UPI0028638D2D|nr:helix-turn-helix domain-containing protein [Microbacterium sp. BE35]MDR7189736.1 excisionase family DNA binding protein [Microbacterium sp. BE35]
MRNSHHAGHHIGSLLAASGRDQAWLAQETGIAAEMLRSLIAGDTQYLSLEDAATIADALNVELPVLIHGNSEEAVGIPQIARLLRVSTDTAYRKARTGEIPGFKLGGLWRFFPSEVKAHVTTPKADPWAQSARSRSRKRVA